MFLKHIYIHKVLIAAAILLVSGTSIVFFHPIASWVSGIAQASDSPLEVWWPTDGTVVDGSQPFKAMLENTDVNQYDVYWQVDNGQLNQMNTSSDGTPHKESQVDISGWDWHGTGPYVINFVAKQNGNVVAEHSVTIMRPSSAIALASVVASSTNATSTAGDTSVSSTTQTDASTTQALASTTTSTLSASSTAPVQLIQVPTTSGMVTPISVWWPNSMQAISGTQPFKAVIPGLPSSSYTMSWSVDGGRQNPMTLISDNPHYESTVDVSTWQWSSTGSYNILFTATDSSGNTIATQKVHVFIDNMGVTGTLNAPSVMSVSTPATTTASTVTASSTVAAIVHTVTNPLSSLSLFVNPNSEAASQVAAWKDSRPNDAAALQTIASQSTATWFGNWNQDITHDVRSITAAAAGNNTIPVLVAYNIPLRDYSGSYSSGGSDSVANYLAWIQGFALGIGSNKAIVILEPDALADASTLPKSNKTERIQLLAQAVSILKKNSQTIVYIDAGHAGWVDAATMANELKSAGVAHADGFSLNVSNFMSTSDSIAYGTQISNDLGGTHFVIDTSRNGNGSNNGAWCNPSGMKIGQKPTTNTGNPIVDAFLWIKIPGESDGTCNGGPSAGTWWADYALGLVRN